MIESENVKAKQSPPALDIAWGCRAIAAELGRPERAVFHLLTKGALPCAKKIGNRWCADRSALRTLFRGPEPC
jgi:hypothetical protein